MFLSLASVLIFIEKRAFHNSSESLITLWGEWELRLIVMLSLLLQIILIVLGNQRKHNRRNWIAAVLWLAYLIADTVAITALSYLSCSQSSSSTKSLDPDYEIRAFWAPFLLLHLGGPDTITAYSLEDNELWPRHLLTLILKAALAFYVFFQSLKFTRLSFVAIPIFIAGLIKYAERIWVLRSASIQQLKKSMLSQPDPGANYAKLMKYYSLKEMEGYNLEFKVIQIAEYNNVMSSTLSTIEDKFAKHVVTVNVAYDFFLTYKRLLADLILRYQDLQNSMSFFKKATCEEAFNVIEIELEFMYDLLFTKATVVHSSWGVLLRFISFSSTVAALVAFCIIDWQAYSGVNVCISLLLLTGAIGLEIFAIIVMLFSIWSVLWSSNDSSIVANIVYKFISSFDCVISKKRWSNSIAEYNLISTCLNDQSLLGKHCGFLNVSWAYKLMEQLKYEPLEINDNDLKLLIFDQIVEKSNIIDSDVKSRKKICNSRGCFVLKKYYCLNDNSLQELHWGVDAVEFDQSIILWHIATDLCYHIDDSEPSSNQDRPRAKVSRLLSNYMMYILVERPSMLPDGIGDMRLQDTKAEAKEFVRERGISNESNAYKELLNVETKIEPSAVKGDRLSKSELFNACRIANLLQSLETEKGWNKEKKWEMISDVWVEMLLYAASHCKWNEHAQQLRRGGQFLTHVWLLMAHFGLTDKLQQRNPRTVMTLS